MKKRILTLLCILTFTLSLVACKIDFGSNDDNPNKNGGNEPNINEPSNPVDNPSNSNGTTPEPETEDFRLVVYYLDQKKVYDDLDIGSTINLDDYIPTVEGYEFKGWYFNKDYTFKYSEDELNVKLENSDLSLCDDTPDIHNNSLYVYAKMLLPTEEDVMPETDWYYQGYQDRVFSFGDIDPVNFVNSLKYLNFSINVTKNGNSFIGTSNLTGTYNFKNKNYIMNLVYSNTQNITLYQEDNNFSYHNNGEFYYDSVKIYSKETCDYINSFSLYGGKSGDSIVQNVSFNENSQELRIQGEVNGYYDKFNFVLTINENGKMIIKTYAYFHGSNNGIDGFYHTCNIQDTTTIENFNLNPVFTYDSNGNVTAIKIDATYQE